MDKIVTGSLEDIIIKQNLPINYYGTAGTFHQPHKKLLKTYQSDFSILRNDVSFADDETYDQAVGCKTFAVPLNKRSLEQHSS